jgi:hypothetical protein
MVEARIASAHGLAVKDVRGRLRRQIGAVAEGSGAGLLNWRFVRRGDSGEPIVLRTVWIDPRVSPQRAPYATELRSKRVAIIGCGAVGWAVANLLARSGIRQFALYDDDQIHEVNLSRLGARLDQIGAFKVTVLAEGLEAIALGVKARPLILDVGRSVGAAALVADEPDLLINLTGEELSTLETNRAALVLGHPAIFAWVSNGVWAGRIFRVRPFETPCYECVRQSEPAPLHSLGWLGPAEPWTGSVIDVECFAAAVAQTAVRTLLGQPSSERNPDHVVLDFLATVPLATPVLIERDRDCAECGVQARGVRDEA